MKNNKNIAIIGAGITGLVAANFYSMKGYDVSIFESSHKIGGITNDLDFENNLFFSGCHQLISNKWLNELNKNNLFNLKKYKVHYGNYTEVDKKNINYDWGYSVPTFQKKIKLPSVIKKISNLEQRLNFYPKLISSFLIKWIKLHNKEIDLKMLSPKSVNGIAMSKIALKKNLILVQEIKKKDRIFDEIYAIRNYLINRNSQRCLIPDKGYSFFFDKLKKILKKKKINIHTRSPVKPIWNKDNLSLMLRGKNFKFNKILWTGNPVSLIKNYNGKKLDSKYIDVNIICGKLKNKINNCFFIQVYSIYSCISRIYIYNINDETKFTIESFKNEKNEDILKTAKNILLKFKIEIKVDSKIFKKNLKRYSLVTNKDDKIIQQFLNKVKNTNLCNYDWRIYGRDQRINSIIK